MRRITHMVIIPVIPGVKVTNAEHACMQRHLNLKPAKHEEVAIYVINQRIPNGCKIARITK